MLPDDVYHRHLSPPRIVEIRETVAEAGTEIKESACRPFSYARIAIRSSGDNSFEEAEHSADIGDPVKGVEDVDFGSARIRKAGVDASCRKRAYQAHCSLHLSDKVPFLITGLLLPTEELLAALPFSLKASTANAVAASLMKRPTFEDALRRWFNEDDGHDPSSLLWLLASHGNARFIVGSAAGIPACRRVNAMRPVA
jgi:hypothetical protein